MGAGSSAVKPEASSTSLKTRRGRDGPKISKEPKERATEQARKKEVEENLIWPLPEVVKQEEFVPDETIEVNRYKLAQHEFKKIDPTNRRPIKITKLNFPRVQAVSTKKTEDANSRVFNSSNVQVTLKATTGLTSSVSPGSEMTNLVTRLNVAHIESNEAIQERLNKLSAEAERVIGKIIYETSEEQNRLLTHAQNVQAVHEELYRKWLQMYVVKLGEWKSAQLNKEQDKLEDAKKKINNVLQSKLNIVNQEVETAKRQIFEDEQARQAKEVEGIVSDAKEATQKKKNYDTGTETNTDIHLKIRSNVGNGRSVFENKSDLEDTSKWNELEYPYLE